ncbi:putative methyltransferase-like protein 24 isoform X1 [Babylonia areolata]|uniref:putative methyltransferase-like protein 24 isoform X1 n=1 Tax=Babylonia areolata TaxID=304850 RepID=UPI003FD14327
MTMRGRPMTVALVAVVLVLVVLVVSMKYSGHAQKYEKLVNCFYSEETGDGTEQDPRFPDGQDLKFRAEQDRSLPDDHPLMVYLRKFGRLKNLPTEDEMKTMTDKEVNFIVHSYLDNTEVTCRNIRLGHAGSGGYETCDDYRYRPIKPCVVYDFGIRYDFSFSDDAAKLYGCKVYAFDPSMKADTHQRSANVWYYKIGIGGPKHQIPKNTSSRALWEIKTLSEIKAMLHHDNITLDILKMDIEASEWPALEAMITEGEIHKVRQFLVEIHFFERKFRQRLPILQKLEAAGFRRFRTNMYPGIKPYNNPNVFPVERRCCYEMGFVNENLARDSP